VEEYDPTIEDSYRKQFTVDKRTYLLDILDTAGQEMYSNYQDKYFISGAGFIIVYSITDSESFDKVGKYYDRIHKAKDTDNGIPIILLANKIDLEKERQVSTSQGQEKAKTYDSLFAETSAKTKIGIDDCFKLLVREIRKGQKAEAKENKTGCSLL